MSPRLRVRFSALVLGIVAITAAAPAWAQSYDAARRSLDLSPDPIARSPRLLGMGRLTYVGFDPYNTIRMWEFAGNPTGIGGGDTLSNVDLWPSTSSASSIHDGAIGNPELERQELGARENRLGFEAWYRSARTAYGAAGQVGMLRLDRPFNGDIEQRSSFLAPTIMPVFTGVMPYTDSGRWRYAVRLLYSFESAEDEFREYTRTATGEYLDQDGRLVNPPNFIDPDDLSATTMGGGLAVSWQAAPWLTAAVGGDLLSSELEGRNEGFRNASEITEDRPLRAGQASLIGRLGQEIEWGIDGRAWNGDSEQRWALTVSAGVGADPLIGRGKLLEREEEGTALRSRARWNRGNLEIGAGFNTGYRKVTVTPPALDDPTSFNYFRNTVLQRAGSDSLDLADSVSHGVTEERSWDAGAGLALRVLGGRGMVGAELHLGKGQLDQTVSGHGPESKFWDARGGAEYQLTAVLDGRLGYRYRQGDHDELTQQNEFAGHMVSVGAGFRPTGASWRIESGYAIEWLQADYDDPTEPRSSRQQLAVLLRWAF